MRVQIQNSRNRSLQPLQTAKAITLVETLVVVLAVAVTAAIAIPAAFTQTSAELDRASRRIAADLLYVQSQALHQRKMKSLIFDTDEGFYFYPSDLDPGQPALDPISKKGYLVLFGKACADPSITSRSHTDEFPAVVLEAVALDGNGIIYFDKLGFCSDENGTGLTTAKINITSDS